MKLNMEKVAQFFTDRATIMKQQGKEVGPDLLQELYHIWQLSQNVYGNGKKEQALRVFEIACGAFNVKESEVMSVASDESVAQQQVLVYVLCDGGFLGSSAAEQPEDFYVDERVTFGYKRIKRIENEVAKLLKLLHRQKAPPRPVFHNCGAF